MNRVCLILTFALLCSSVKAQERATGLLFADDQILAAIPLQTAPVSGDPLPAEFSLTDGIPAAGDQGRQNSCVGWAAAYTLKTQQEQRERQWGISSKNGLNHEHVFSPAYIYNQIKIGTDGGAYLTNALDMLCEKGCATWARMPYDENSNDTLPSPEIHKSAKEFVCTTYRRINPRSVHEVKSFLVSNHPVVVGAEVDISFSSLRANDVWKSFRAGAERGGHAMVVIGYSDSRGAFRLANSWGPDWGDKGTAWVGYDQFKTSVREAYIVTDFVPPTPQTPTNPADVNSPIDTNGVRGATIKKKLTEILIQIQFSNRIDDTRSNKVLGNTIGQVGVEYLLDSGKIDIESVTAEPNAESLLGSSTRVTVTTAIIGNYKEKHFKGVGSEYSTRNELDTRSKVQFVFDASASGVKLIGSKVLEEGAKRSTDMMVDGAAAEISKALERLK